MKKRFVILNLYIAIIKNDRIEIIMETRICNSYARKKNSHNIIKNYNVILTLPDR